MEENELIILVEKGLSTHKIAKELNISQTTVRYYLKKFGIKTQHNYHGVNIEFKCATCNETNPNNFYEGKKSICKTCHLKRSISNSKLLPNRERSRFIDNSRRRINKINLINDLGYDGCACCGYKNCIDALDFHHLDSKEKTFTVSEKLGHSYVPLLEEVSKCIPVCKNCHTEIHCRLINPYDFKININIKDIIEKYKYIDTNKQLKILKEKYTTQEVSRLFTRDELYINNALDKQNSISSIGFEINLYSDVNMVKGQKQTAQRLLAET